MGARLVSQVKNGEPKHKQRRRKKDAPGKGRLTVWRLSEEWGMPYYVVQDLLLKEPGVMFYKRQDKKGRTVIRLTKIPPEVAERVRLQHTTGADAAMAS